MNENYPITQKIVSKFVQMKAFKKDDLFKQIRKENGSMEIKPGYTVDDYLNDLIDEDKFRYVTTLELFVKVL